jgi:hypothetical protein
VVSGGSGRKHGRKWQKVFRAAIGVLTMSLSRNRAGRNVHRTVMLGMIDARSSMFPSTIPIFFAPEDGNSVLCAVVQACYEAPEAGGQVKFGADLQDTTPRFCHFFCQLEAE